MLPSHQISYHKKSVSKRMFMIYCWKGAKEEQIKAGYIFVTYTHTQTHTHTHAGTHNVTTKKNGPYPQTTSGLVWNTI